jgi:hypothetical protein
MSVTHSSKATRAAALAVLCCTAGLLLAGCGKGGSSASSSQSAKPLGAVGYVRMDALLKRHPLYSQLARLDDDMAALQLKSIGTGPTLAPAALKKEQAALQREFQQASDRAKAELDRKQGEYRQRESDAVRQALGAAGGAAGSSGASIQAGIQRQYQQQAQVVAGDAQKNLDAYRKQLIGQDRQAIVALQRSLNDSAARSYRTKVEQLQKKEADYALQLATEDSAERLSLRAKLSNLVLDDVTREEARKALEAIDRKEADALAAMKNRDGITLVALQKQLRDQTSAELGRQAGDMKIRTVAKINKRELETRAQMISKLGGLPATAAGGAALPATLSPDMRAKLEALHKKYQDDFSKDAKTTIDEFEKTRTDLAQRFARLQGVDAGAQAGSNKQFDALQKQRNELYDQMVAQIGREIKFVAARRGINVVFSDIIAPAGGIDLTADAEKDIESLHE